MQMRTLGRTGIKLSPYCLGTPMLGGWGNPDHADGVAMVHRALEAGINFVDTADSYSDGSPRPSSARRWPVAAMTW